ncbi:unnamed protein product [Linum trigynum]|uniref:Uncharacterized protein n=1 Tax=Linum trigynum TaxID=586398 RepID=A0AAV2EQF1_9ROSI
MGGNCWGYGSGLVAPRRQPLNYPRGAERASTATPDFCSNARRDHVREEDRLRGTPSARAEQAAVTNVPNNTVSLKTQAGLRSQETTLYPLKSGHILVLGIIVGKSV